ncbi:putative membrane protein [Salmonella enterica subsp. enterica serovar Daytona]|uniref:Putative membrane protein n=1 Tax=Salmonella enterica subsp. enterica serovar Daytona TaxID=1962639 RepID=A0A447JLV9_SALET|nr:putative membrane protein [Salmonella enterica subsp. enterica serovar Daytona]
MPTVITHAAVPLCLGAGLGLKVIPPRLLFAGVVLAMLPMPTCWPLNLASPTATYLAIVDLPILYFSHSSSPCCAYSRDDDGFELGRCAAGCF